MHFDMSKEGLSHSQYNPSKTISCFYHGVCIKLKLGHSKPMNIPIEHTVGRANNTTCMPCILLESAHWPANGMMQNNNNTEQL